MGHWGSRSCGSRGWLREADNNRLYGVGHKNRWDKGALRKSWRNKGRQKGEEWFCKTLKNHQLPEFHDSCYRRQGVWHIDTSLGSINVWYTYQSPLYHPNILLPTIYYVMVLCTIPYDRAEHFSKMSSYSTQRSPLGPHRSHVSRFHHRLQQWGVGGYRLIHTNI